MLGTRKTTTIVLALSVILGLGGGAAGAAVVTATSGDAAAPGAPGADGGSGEQGAPGMNGVNGRDGADGNDGNDGKVGAAGKDGATGLTGAKGDQGAIGADGTPGLAGAIGATGLTGPAGPAGPAGSTSSAIAWAEATAAQQSVAANGSVLFNRVGGVTGAFDSVPGGIEVLQDGKYELSYSVRPVPGQVSTVSLAQGDNPSFIAHVNSVPHVSTRVYRPALNVQIPLVLSMKVLVDGAAVEYSGLHEFPAGSIVTLHAEGDSSATPLTASLRILRLR